MVAEFYDELLGVDLTVPVRKHPLLGLQYLQRWYNCALRPCAVHGVVTEGDVARRGTGIQADAGLEPLLVFADQADQSRRRVTQPRRQSDDIVERRLRSRV